MEVELKKPEKEFDVEWHPTPEGKSIPPEEPVKCKSCVEGTCDHHTINKYEALPEAEYPKEITTVAASNGYLFKIGCQVFVCEGDVDKATNALKRYLTLDSSVVKEYSCKFEKRDMLYDDFDLRPEPEAEEKATSRLKTPVFSSFRNKNPDVAIFNVVNGTVTLNYHTGEATVKQGFFTAHEFKSEIK